MRIAIVNDSQIAREALRRIIASDPGHTLAWTAENGREAVAKAHENTPDIILMDLIMPDMDGVEATRQIMALSPCAILVVTASVRENTPKVFEAMGAGALDAVNTPVLGTSGTGEGRTALLTKLETVKMLLRGQARLDAALGKPKPCAHDHPEQQLIAIGASTGGPAALAEVLGALPQDIPAAIVVVQHVDEQFVASFAEWLGGRIQLPVRLAQEGEAPRPGTVLVAGRHDHLVLKADKRLGYSADPVDYPYRPSVNAFFSSLVTHWQGEVTGVLLTGMGRDGAEGLLALRGQGWHTLAQDMATSAVYGMPKAAAELDAAVSVLPLGAIGDSIANRHKKHNVAAERGS
ncbi:MAG TPA: chemotaxis response regulator protein-glutamate methylesterase [Gammaproteobacteria bacterium]|nr:chemotaxis response regulator protein-glutamate methylesterase [Gammaproteobacteria bacterium]